MEGGQAFALVVAGRAEGDATAVHFVAEQRVPTAGTLHANLVGAASFEGDLEQAGSGEG